MKEINRRKLNNKGFTLIELLAVVVILAVVMGIAMTSVLSSMNKSRGGALQDSAMVIANAFTQKYTESLVGGVPNDIYADVNNATGYNFQTDATYTISSKLANTFNINVAGYSLSENVTKIEDATEQTHSTVSFDASTGRFVVCMVANPTGSYFVDNYKLSADGKVADIIVKTVPGEGENPAPVNTYLTFAKDNVVACSDGSRSWQ